MAFARADDVLNLPASLRAGNGLKGMSLLLLIATVGGALLLAPALRKAPDTRSFVHLPAMSNVPPAVSLQLEQQQP